MIQSTSLPNYKYNEPGEGDTATVFLLATGLASVRSDDLNSFSEIKPFTAPE